MTRLITRLHNGIALSFFVFSAAASAAVAPTFSSIYSNIFAPACLRCHSGPRAKGDLDLSSYATLMRSKTVVAGSPEQSDLYWEIAHDDMPLHAPPLSAEQLTAVQTWIRNGAPND